MYSFDAGGARFVVLNDNDTVSAWYSFLVANLGDAPEGAPVVAFPTVSIDRVRSEFGFAPRSVLSDLPHLVAEFRKVVPVR